MKSARVVGAGLSGLASAWALTDAGVEVEVVDARGEPGGLIGTLRAPEGLVERAANAFLWTETTARWFDRLGIEPAFAKPQSRARYIFRGGRASRWPLGPAETAAMAARAGAAWLTGRLSPAPAETVGTWSRRTLGPAAAEWLIAPVLQGLYAAPIDRLSARAIAQGRRHARASSRRVRKAGSAAPRDGMGAFVARLVAQLRHRGVVFRLGSAVQTLDPATPTIVAVDAATASTLVRPHAPALADAIGAVEMAPTVSATAFFEPHPGDLHGFGVLFPRSSGILALGVLFNADIFDARSTLRSETWIYGVHGSPEGLPPIADLPEIVTRDRQRLTGRTATPVAVRTAWSEAFVPSLPVYGPAVLEVRERLSDLPPWLALAGNYLGRLGVARLLDVAEEAAGHLLGARRT